MQNDEKNFEKRLDIHRKMVYNNIKEKRKELLKITACKCAKTRKPLANIILETLMKTHTSRVVAMVPLNLKGSSYGIFKTTIECVDTGNALETLTETSL